MDARECQLEPDAREELVQKLKPYLLQTLFHADLEEDYVLHGVDWPGLLHINDIQLVALAKKYNLLSPDEEDYSGEH